MCVVTALNREINCTFALVVHAIAKAKLGSLPSVMSVQLALDRAVRKTKRSMKVGAALDGNVARSIKLRLAVSSLHKYFTQRLRFGNE